MVRGRQGSCSCASQTSSGSSARTRSWPSVRGSSSSPKRTATSPPTTTGPARLDDDHLQAARVARRRDEAEPGQQLELAVDRLVARAGRLDPLADRVVVLRARVLELLPLNVNRPSGEEVVAAAVVEVQVRVDDDVDAGEVEGRRSESETSSGKNNQHDVGAGKRPMMRLCRSFALRRTCAGGGPAQHLWQLPRTRRGTLRRNLAYIPSRRPGSFAHIRRDFAQPSGSGAWTNCLSAREHSPRAHYDSRKCASGVSR